MKKLFKYTKTDKIIRLTTQIAATLIVFELLYTAISYFSLPPLVPLYNQLSWGEERLGLRFEFFIPSLIALIFLFSNLLLINKIYEKMPLVARIISITTLLISLLSFIFTVQTLHIIL